MTHLKWPRYVTYISLASVGRGDSSHLVTRGDSSHSPFRGEKTWKSKKCYYHSKGQVIISKWPRFQPNNTYISILPKFPKKIHFFYPREIWLEPKSCFCSIYHNFVINEYFDQKFAVCLAIAFHYDVLKGVFDTFVVVVAVGARSRLAFFRNLEWLIALFLLFF